MSKLGKPYQLVVADVLQEMDPDSMVNEGQWVTGPDGHRDIDVLIEGTVDGVRRRVQIECRDYNPQRRPIGIAQIDALESKHHDLEMDLTLLCSNAGFTSDAIRKAKRQGIGLIGVLRQNDPRIRYRIFDEIYVRRVEFEADSSTINFHWRGEVPPQGDLQVEDITFNGLPVLNWLSHRVQRFLAINPVVKGEHTLTFTFFSPVEFTLPNGTASAQSTEIKFSISGGWIAQKIEIDATSGLYDWMRQAVRPGPGANTVSYKGVSFGKGGNPIRCPPGFDPEVVFTPLAGEVGIWMLDLGGFALPKSYPDLDPFVDEEGTAKLRSKISTENYFS